MTRTGWTSEIGYEVYLTDSSKGTDVYEAIMERRASRSASSRPGRRDIRRIEGGIFNWGADMTYENNAFELGLDRLVDLDSLPRRRVHLDRGLSNDPRAGRDPTDQRRRRSTATPSRR